MDPEDPTPSEGENHTAGRSLTHSITDSVPSMVVSAEVIKINETALAYELRV